jgi:tRNA dimethylallyltransferase
VADNLIVIAGPTATGKSALARKLALDIQRRCGIGSEIVNADSIQLYSELKTLSAYPSPNEQEQVPHHLYGILEPNEKSSVATWLDLAEQKILQLQGEEKIPIVCGGTGLYVRALLEGIAQIPPIPASFRQEVAARFQDLGREEFFDLLQTIDPESCKTLHKNNTQRILRAYEVAAYTGTPISEWWKKNVGARSTIPLILLPPRAELYKRCLLRVNTMLQTGAVSEVNSFLSRYQNYRGPLTSAIGYNEILSFLRGNISLSECCRLMFLNTKHYAKRQYTWFRHQVKFQTTIREFGDTITSCTGLPSEIEKIFE